MEKGLCGCPGAATKVVVPQPWRGWGRQGEKLFRQGQEVPLSMDLCSHMSISCEFCYSTGLLSLHHPVQPPSTLFVHSPGCSSLPGFPLAQFTAVLYLHYPIGSLSSWPLLCTPVPCSYWTLSLSSAPSSLYLTLCFQFFPSSHPWSVWGCPLCMHRNKQLLDFQTGSCLLAFIVSPLSAEHTAQKAQFALRDMLLGAATVSSSLKVATHEHSSDFPYADNLCQIFSM